MRILLLFLALLPAACASTPNRPDPEEGEAVTITADELEPMRGFVLETRRVIAAEFVRIEVSTQYFEQQLGFTRDLRYCERSPTRILKDGTRVIEIRRTDTEQATNIDPDLLPRAYFGGSGLEVRAYVALRIYLRPPSGTERPLFVDVQAKSSDGNAMCWTSGRLSLEKPSIRLRSELIWSEDKEEYVHRSSVG